MGYEPNFPANQLGGQKILWVIVEYGLSGIWVRRESTVEVQSRNKTFIAHRLHSMVQCGP